MPYTMTLESYATPISHATAFMAKLDKEVLLHMILSTKHVPFLSNVYAPHDFHNEVYKILQNLAVLTHHSGTQTNDEKEVIRKQIHLLLPTLIEWLDAHPLPPP